MKTRNIVVLVFIFALAIRLAAVAVAARSNSIEVWEYEDIAMNILKGAGYQMQHLGVTNYTFCPPAYPFFSAFIYFLTGHNIIMLAASQAVISAFGCVVIFRIAGMIFDNRTALLSSTITALHPGVILYVTKLHSFNIDWVLFAILIFMLFKALLAGSVKYFIFFGLIFGACFLARSTALLYLPAVIVYLFFVKGHEKNKLMSLFAVSLISAAVVVIPWAARNYMRLGQIEFVQKSGYVFWRGNNPNATGTSYSKGGIPMIETAPPEFLKRLYSLDEKGQDNLFWEEGLNFIKKHPLKCTLLYAKKFYYFWWFSPHYGINYKHTQAEVYKFLYAVLFISADIGITAALLSQDPNIKQYTLMLIMFFLTVSLSQSLFYVDGRHRLAIEPLLLIFSAHGIFLIKDNFKNAEK